MAKVEKSVLIGVPPEKVHGFARDWRNLQRYMDYMKGALLRRSTVKRLSHSLAVVKA